MKILKKLLRVSFLFLSVLGAVSYAAGPQDNLADNPQEIFRLKQLDEQYLAVVKKSLTVDVSDLSSNQSLDEALKRSLLQSYIRVFLEFPNSFYPYKTSKELALEPISRLIQKHLCTNEMALYCLQHSDLEQDIQYVLKQDFKEHQQLFVDREKKNHNTFVKLNQNIEELKPLFKNYQLALNPSLIELGYTLAHSWSSTEEYNTQLFSRSTSWSTVQQEYLLKYQQLGRDYPGRILWVKSIMDLIEGDFFRLETIDIQHAVEELTKTLKRDFILQLVIHSFQTHGAQRLGKIFSTQEQIHLSQIKSQTLAFWFEEDPESQRFPVYSKIYPPYIQDELSFHLFQKYSVKDAKALYFLSQNEFQRAIWRLGQIGQRNLASDLAQQVTQQIMGPKNLLGIKNLGMGFTTTYLTSFPLGQKGVYKPKILFITNPAEYFAASYKNEIAAYVVDQLLHLDMVPITIKTQHQGYKKGSQQYFVKDTFRARDMNQFDYSKSGKFSHPTGRSIKSSNILYFDWLIANKDRNLDNYLFFPDGEIALIDHGFSFIRGVSKNPSGEVFMKMRPSQKIYEQVLFLNRHPEIVKADLREWLSAPQLRDVIDKLRYTQKVVELLDAQK